MVSLFLLSSVVYFALVVFLAHGFVKHHRNEKISRISNWFSTLFFVYLLLFILSLLWYFDYLLYDSSDFLVIFALLITVQTVILFRTHYLVSGNKAFLYLLVFYVFSLFFLFFSLQDFFEYLIIISFFLSVLLFFNFKNLIKPHRLLGLVGVFYGIVSFIFAILLYFNAGDLLLYSFLSSLVFLFFVFLFYRGVENKIFVHSKIKSKRKEPLVLYFARYFVFIIIFSSLAMISTIGIHEAGHAITSRVLGCDYTVILYEPNSYPKTEVICDNLAQEFYVALLGPVFPLVLALLLFLLGGEVAS